MSLSIGIVGLPNVGKSTLFQTITKKQVDIANYPFCTINPNVGVVEVPDERLDKLALLCGVAKKIRAVIEFVDIAGLVKGAAEGQGLGNKFLANIRETDAIVYVLRAFGNENIINTQENINPVKEKEILDVELILKDLETANKRLGDLEKDVRTGKKEAKAEFDVLSKTKNFLLQEKILFGQAFSEPEQRILQNFQFLTAKPRIYLLNGKESDVSKEILEVFNKNNWHYLIIDLLTELEAADLTKQERIEIGLAGECETEVLIKKTYELLGLISFFSTLSGEVKAWPIKKGTKIPQAAGVIHTDFEKNFIKAEVINWRDLLGCSGFAAAKAKGQIRIEGKDYIVQDGDVVEIKHSP